MDVEPVPEVRCPGCSGLAWARDGFAVAADGPRIDAGRYAASSGTTEPWQCRDCGHQLQESDPLAGALTQLQQAHWE